MSQPTDFVSVIGRIWSEALGVEQVAPADDFFELGGDSVVVTIMALQVEEAFDLVVDPGLVFEHPTLAGFAAQIAEIASEPAA